MAKPTNRQSFSQPSRAQAWGGASSARSPVGPETGALEQVAMFSADHDAAVNTEKVENGKLPSDPIRLLKEIVDYNGNLIDLLGMGRLGHIPAAAIREYEMDDGERQAWLDVCERGMDVAAQEYGEQGQKDYPFQGASDIRYPLLTTAVGQFVSRASPELINGDEACGFKTFDPIPQDPGPQEAAKLGAPPPPGPTPDPQQQAANAAQVQAQQGAAQQAVNQGVQQENQDQVDSDQREAKGRRQARYINWLLFYGMFDGDEAWEDDLEAMLTEGSICGSGYKKAFPTPTGPKTEFVSATCLVYSIRSKSLWRCPRVTQVFEKYPYEIEQLMAQGVYRSVDFMDEGEDPQEPREMLEQYRYEDLDGDGVSEPYICTLERKTEQLLRVEPAFNGDDILLDEEDRVMKIKRWLPYAAFKFLPHPKRNPYGLGLAQLLDQIMASVDTSINQLNDAGNAQIAGGGFIAGNLRLPNAGQAGDVWIAPGEYQTVDIPGADIRAAIWERTVPQPSDVTMKLLEFLLAAAKDVAAIKDVITGDTPATAPVGTTFALQQTAMAVHSSIFRRAWRTCRQEFRLIAEILRRFPTDTDRKQYKEITGGDLDEDFSGGGDIRIQPVADPTVVTDIQKSSRVGSTIQLAESPIGQAAGMTQPDQAQEIAKEALRLMKWDRPERFVGPVGPNPEVMAKAQDLAAAAVLKKAQAEKAQADATRAGAQTLREVGLAAVDTQHLHGEAARMERTGMVEDLSAEGSEAGQAAQPSAPQAA